VRDRSVAAGHDAGDLARGKARHTRDHIRGFMARTRERLSRAPIDDDQLYERIRSRLGRLVAHPGEVHLEVNQGRVVLRGTASDREIDALLDTVASMRGVESIDNRLSVGETAISRH
jgi:osmotically-inducible protein OsmY